MCICFRRTTIRPPGTRCFVDLGDIPLPSGVQIEGRIIDEEGKPITGLSLQLVNEGIGGTGGTFPNMLVYTKASESDGRFVSLEALVPGTWESPMSQAFC